MKTAAAAIIATAFLFVSPDLAPAQERGGESPLAGFFRDLGIGGGDGTRPKGRRLSDVNIGVFGIGVPEPAPDVFVWPNSAIPLTRDSAVGNHEDTKTGTLLRATF